MFLDWENSFFNESIRIMKFSISIDLVFFKPTFKLLSILKFYCAFSFLHVANKRTPILIVRCFQVSKSVHLVMLEESFIYNLKRIFGFIFVLRLPNHLTFSFADSRFEGSIIGSPIRIGSFSLTFEVSIMEVSC